MRSVGLAVCLLLSLASGCHPAPPPPAPAPAPEVSTCDGPSPAAGPSALTANLDSAFVCDPRPGAAGWIHAGSSFSSVPKLPPCEAAPLDVQLPRFALVFDGRDGPRLEHALSTLRNEADYRLLVAGARAPRGAAHHAPPTRAGIAELLAALRRELQPGAMLVLLAAEVDTLADDPWGCIPLQDACLPLAELQLELAELRTGARIVVLAQARPRLAFSALTDATAVVVTFPSGQVGDRAARAFWSPQVPDRDGDGVIAVRERAAQARRIDRGGVRFVDPLGTLSFARRQARARGSAPLEVEGRPALDAAVAGLAPGQIAVVNLSTTWCAACGPFRTTFANLARRTGGPMRFIHAETDEQWQGFGALSYPAVAFIAPGGRLLGVAHDPYDPLSALALGEFESIDDRLAYHRAELRSREHRVRGRGARALLALGPPGAALIEDLARDLHDEPVAAIVLDILQALASYGEKARHTAPEMVALFNHADGYVRQMALLALRRIGADPRPVACPLLALVADPDAGVRSAAIDLLAADPSLPPAILPALRVIMEDESPAVRRVALAAFRRLPWGDAAIGALPTLLRLVTPGEPDDQRAEAIAALIELGPRATAAIPDLTRLLADADPAIVRQAALALGNHGAAASCAVPSLAALAADPDPHTRRKSGEAMAKIGADRRISRQ
ncbi:HEAT repeat domain-containing protein [Nannocystis sp. ILAH1]|uniref:HEAT repeat domain-containing protein n=2 Tax=Nannocystis sp. ILAH1 TaxID=2996789 RepID=UPI00226DD0F6|nr:HEAT repeat domain-containing protein [Nannocystis sp. ILAH1]MCY0988639.1 HEAT repeat domain-containing protein [Nannocystis sp. ILAH1]